jgi:serine protease AprX
MYWGGLGGTPLTAVNLCQVLSEPDLRLIDAVAETLLPRCDHTVESVQRDHISLDRQSRRRLDYTADAVNAPLAWSAGLDGTGVGIAIIDSGIYSHPDLNRAYSTQSRVVYRQSFVSGGVKNDDFGHGTHVAGIAAGNGSSSNVQGSFRALRGIASNANLVDLRVLDGNGMSTDSAVIAAIQQAVNLKSSTIV